MQFSLMKLFLYLICIFLLSAYATSQKDCFNGVLVNGSCVCNPGFAGNKCQDCAGRYILSEREGTISDGPNVAHFSDCLAIIKPSVSFKGTLHVQFKYVAPSCKCDFLTAYEGDSVHGPYLATFNGDVLPTRMPEVTSIDGVMTLQFHNDGKIFFDEGYEISYWIKEDEDTSHNRTEEVVTSCSGLWCSYNWESMMSQGRASAGIALIEEDLFVFGGKMFGTSNQRIEFLKLNTSSKEWESLADVGESPLMRHSHTMVAWKNVLLLHGGAFANNTITNELWEFNVKRSQWRLLLDNSTSGDKAPPLIGHSSHVTSYRNGTEVMLLFFGFHPSWLISSQVFQFDLANRQWKPLSTNGALPIGTYGHASALDPDINAVFIHGGFNFNIYNHLYKYDVEKMSWLVLPSSPHSTYLHTMSIIAGSLYLFGGKGEVPSLDRCDLCPEVPTTAFDIDCMEWKIVPEDLLIASPRYGHSAELLSNRTMLIYGGYDGTMKNDAITFIADNVSCVVTNQSEISDKSCQTDGTRSNHSCVTDENTMCHAICASFGNCDDCRSSACSCCYDDFTSLCFYSNASSCDDQEASCDENSRKVRYCAQMQTCDACQWSGCWWDEAESFCGVEKGNMSPGHCQKSCLDASACVECAEQPECIWCESTSSCFPMATTAVYFPYGGCSSYVSAETQCNFDSCHAHQSCDECFIDDKCGWCDFGSDTGYGSCMSGSLHGPINTTCSSEQWHFIDCPACQCNGHSTCSPDRPDRCVNCDVGTTGPTCDHCDALYFGDPTNGRNCSACECNNHATQCSNEGSCYCDVKGIVGKNCERCSTTLGYHGDAIKNTCFYSLDVKYEYRIPLDSYESINFDTCPPETTSVTVKVDTLDNSPFNITISTNGTELNETVYVTLNNVSKVEVDLPQSIFQFGKSSKRCIRIYLVEAHNNIIVSVPQQKTTIGRLVMFFLVSFLSMLVVAGIVWKATSIVLNRRRRARITVERKRMASRPFSFVHLCVQEEISVQEKSSTSNEDESPFIVTEEICQSQRAAVLTSLLWLPTESDATPASIAFGTFLATRHDCEDDVKIEIDSQPKMTTRIMTSWKRRVAGRARTSQVGIINMNYVHDES